MMNYDAIILELLSRIQTLEEEVVSLKKVICDNSNKLLVNESAEESSSKNKKMTDAMIDLCYKGGKKVHSGDNIQEIADDIVDETGMNRNSAIMYMQVVCCLLDGIVYKRAINSKALQKYYDNIWNEYGSDGLKKAIIATREHISYRRELGHPVDSIEEICSKAEARL